MDVTTMILSLVKIVAVIAYLYGLFWVLGVKFKKIQIAGRQVDPSIAVNILGGIVAFGIIQLALTEFNGVSILERL